MTAKKDAISKALSKYNVTVLRLGHRLVRDERISTHIGLVARAFGASRLVLTGADDHTVESLRRMTLRWGGDFKVDYSKNWRETVRNFQGCRIHLTMYGENLEKGLGLINESNTKNLLLIIGAEKVPREVYSLADLNVSVGNQPHSEVAALAVFLDRLFMGEELHNTFGNARVRIKPSLQGKKVEFVENENRV